MGPGLCTGWSAPQRSRVEPARAGWRAARQTGSQARPAAAVPRQCRLVSL